MDDFGTPHPDKPSAGPWEGCACGRGGSGHWESYLELTGNGVTLGLNQAPMSPLPPPLTGVPNNGGLLWPTSVTPAPPLTRVWQSGPCRERIGCYQRDLAVLISAIWAITVSLSSLGQSVPLNGAFIGPVTAPFQAVSEVHILNFTSWVIVTSQSNICPRGGHSVEIVKALYGETIMVPCNNGDNNPEGLLFTKWKYEKDDGTPGDLLVKQAHKDEATVSANDGYQSRVSIAANSSLLITKGTMADERTFTCMVVSMANLKEYPVEVQVLKKPAPPQIKDKVKELENGKLTTLGVCEALDANPPADIIWLKNGKPLVGDGTKIIITPTVTKDPSTKLSSTSSKLQYTAEKDDVGSEFSCSAHHSLGNQDSAPESFSIHYPTEEVKLQVLTQGPIKEGDNVTLKCQADGNPPPTNFNFNIKGTKVPVTGSDSYTLTGVTRADSGEYKCSLMDNDKMEGGQNIVVNYLDFRLSPSGRVLKNAGDTLEVVMEKNASGDAKVIWTKDNGKLSEPPVFDKLTYADAGLYVCEVSVAGLKRSGSFHLVVEGVPVITKLSKEISADGQHKVLTCEAMGSPQPDVQWSVNGTAGESSYSNGKATYKLLVVPNKNMTVHCQVSNKLGEDSMAIHLLPLFEEEQNPSQDKNNDSDQSKLIVGVIIGLIVAAALVGIIYWLYVKKTRQGSWKTGEKEAGTSEESKKLEENNHKAEV
ncbi:CD166 antigen homolog A [Chanos chanos]|uniref:CD166 antigen homolog A n=1 Tax=Chanos chanos TaxID=29144 RepID=A0A6J2WV47_CHACN|nr:CD166 antigen homolog [Chanos chanos]